MFIPVQEQLVQFFYGTSLTHTVILNDGDGSSPLNLLRFTRWCTYGGFAGLELGPVASNWVPWADSRAGCACKHQDWINWWFEKPGGFIVAYLVVFCLYYISHLIDSCFLLILFAEKCPSIHLPIHSMFSYHTFLLHELSWLYVFLSYLLLFQ